MMSPRKDIADTDNEPRVVGRVVDMKIPLVWLLGCAGGMALLLSSMYWQLQEVSKGMADLQIIVRSGNNQSTVMAGEIALMKFRLEKVELDQARMQNGKGH